MKKQLIRKQGSKFLALTVTGSIMLSLCGSISLFPSKTQKNAVVYAAETSSTNADTTTEPSSTSTEATEEATSEATSEVTSSGIVKELKVSNQTMTSITLTWDAVSNAYGYLLQSFDESNNTWSELTKITSVANKDSYSHVVTELLAGTAHRYRICSYVKDTTNRSEMTTSIRTGTLPSVTQIATIKGSQAVRINWNAVTCSGYNIYMKSGNGSYELIADITNPSTTTYRKNTLSNGVTYTFKVCPYTTYSAIDSGVSYSNKLENNLGNEATVIPSIVGKTSSSAYLSSTKTAFKATKAYKTYALAKKINYTKSFVMPGLSNTNVNGINSTNFLSQGTVCAKSYYFIGAYDSTGVENSVIYVMKRSTHKYVMTLVLPNTNKITDMAFDGTNIWMTNGNEVASVRYKAITSLISTGLESSNLSYMKTYTTISNPTYLGYYNNTLWVGSFSTSKNYMSGYTITNMTSTDPSLTYNYRMQMPGKTKAITIDSDGMLYVTRSYQVKKGLSGYVSQVRSYSPSWTTVNSSKLIKKNTAKKKCKLPAMACGITIYNTYTYISFESAKASGCKYPTDRSWAIKTYRLH